MSLVLSLVMPPISQAIANDGQAGSTEETVTAGGSSTESTDVENTNNVDTENQNSDETEGDETGDDALRAAPLSDDTGARALRSLRMRSLLMMKLTMKAQSPLPTSVPMTIPR